MQPAQAPVAQGKAARSWSRTRGQARPAHRRGLLRGPGHRLHSEPSLTQICIFSLQAKLEETALPCQAQLSILAGASSNKSHLGALIAPEARDPIGQPIIYKAEMTPLTL